MPIIEVRDLSKTYKSAVKEPGLGGAVKHLFKPEYKTITAVDRVNLSIEAGETVAYVGPNGAGKSTTIKMLTGILMPSAGTVTVKGLDPYKDRMKNAQNMGVVFGQRTQLWWDIAVVESFTLIRDIYGLSKKDYEDNLAYLTEVLQLEPFLHSSARKLSLGQRMRADLAVSLLYNPALLFLDEPTIGLDVAVKERIREFLHKVNTERGTTILLTSHDLDDIKDTCERLVIIDKGIIVYDGRVNELLNRYVTQRRMLIRLQEASPSLIKGLESTGGITLRNVADKELTLDFDRFRYTAKDIITQVMAGGEVVDFQLEEPDIEQVVKQVYEGKLSLDPMAAKT